jgi:hypothetical protein
LIRIEGKKSGKLGPSIFFAIQGRYPLSIRLVAREFGRKAAVAGFWSNAGVCERPDEFPADTLWKGALFRSHCGLRESIWSARK